MVVQTPFASQYPDRWKAVEALFYKALDQEPETRDAFVQQECSEDQELYVEVSRLLSLHDSEDIFLEPPDESLQSTALKNQLDQWIGKQFGSFRITQLISSGGMGSVWRAERADDQFTQQVALKLMNVGIGSADRLRRFEQERQTLAQLEHPYITRLIDGGTTNEGMPYLVMEYVDGQRIDQYCDEHRLTISARLQLFCEVCEAVQYAHQNLIVHRDLKPGNIFITHDGKPKLLDFGISKLLDDPSQLPLDHTHTAFRAMTPQYASPEQVLGESITTVSDVYSLGVVLYELLTGHSPYALNTTSNYHQQRIICEQEPVQPSLIVNRTQEEYSNDTAVKRITPAMIGEIRNENVRQLQRRLRGDLDNIVLKALQKKPPRRYNSIQQFSEDIQRYLTGMPVLARKDSVTYRATKFVRRHKWYVSLFVALMITLSAGIVGTLSGLKRARHERDVAVKVTSFLQDILTSANPYEEGHDTIILQLLDDASQRVEKEFIDQPEVAASISHTIATAYSELWLFTEAIPHAQKAVELKRQMYGDTHLTTVDSLMLLGRALYFRNQAESVKILREALVTTIEYYDDDIPRIAEIKSRLATALWLAADPPQWDEADRLYQQSIDLYRPIKDRHIVDFTVTLQRYAAMFSQQNKYDDQTTAIFDETFDLYQQQPELRDRNRAEFMRMYSYSLKFQRRYEEEAEALEEFIAMTPHMFQEHFNISRSLWRLVELNTVFLQSNQAPEVIRRALRLECKEIASRSKAESALWEDIALSFEEDIDIVQSMILIQKMIASMTDHTCVEMELFHNVAKVARHACFLGHVEDADLLLKDSIKAMRQRYPSLPHLLAFSIGVQGVCRMYTEKWDEAEPYLLESYRLVQSGYSMKDGMAALATRRLIQLYTQTENQEQLKIYQDVMDNLKSASD